MTDHDQQLPRFPTQIYGEAVGRTHPAGMAARPRLFLSYSAWPLAPPAGLRRQPVPPVRSVLEWAYGYSDETIWQRRSDAVMPYRSESSPSSMNSASSWRGSCSSRAWCFRAKTQKPARRPTRLPRRHYAAFGTRCPPPYRASSFCPAGQADDEATENLDAINRLARSRVAPWQLSFSFARALQMSPLELWAGKSANQREAQAAFLERARATSVARGGEYAADAEGKV